MTTIDEAPPRNAAARAHLRLMELAKTDPQIAAAVPIDAVWSAMQEPGIAYCEVIARALGGYSGRAALGMRAYEIDTDPRGRKNRRYLSAFSTITYAELARDLEAAASAWLHHPRHRIGIGEFVGLIAFASTEMATLDLACAYVQAVAIPLQANLPAIDMLAILDNTAPTTIVASIDNLELAADYARKQESVRSLIVIDSDLRVDDERERIEAVRRELCDGGDRIALATFAELVEYGSRYAWTPLPRSAEGEDALTMLMHTSGSTGTPKGAMIHEAMAVNLWVGLPMARPSIHLVCAPLNHFMGRSQVFGALAQGGTAYFTLKSDMATLFEDIRIARPTAIMLFPRIAEIIHQTYRSEVQRRVAAGGDPAAVDAAVRAEMGGSFLGDRLLSGGLAGSPTAPEVQAFLRECFDLALIDGYSSTEAGTGAITVSGQIQRGTVLDYRLIDVPELGYYTTDRPHPRGELLLKSRFSIKGYYKRPDATAAIYDDEGWLQTGDIVEERGPDTVVWIGRRNNVIKLSQGEYVALGPLEATYLGQSALIDQMFLYGSSYRSFLLAVIVPDMAIAETRCGRRPDRAELRAMVLAELQEVAREAGLKSFEVPRDVLIELDPFTHENGLLSSVRKPLHPKLKARYQDDLEAIYSEMDRKQRDELAQLRAGDSGLSTLDRVAGALKANLGLSAVDRESPQSYTDLGGDSLGAVSLSLLLEDIFGVAVPVSVLLDPAGSAGRLARYVDNIRARSGAPGVAPSFADVHGDAPDVIRAGDLTLDAFLDARTLEAATLAAPPVERTRTVLLTGATGFLGRFLALEWMEALAASGGKVICLVRAPDIDSARARIFEAIGTADPELSSRFRELADACLEPLPGDLATPLLGLDEPTFARLCEEVDQIVHPGALVNHLLSYRNLFEPNVVGTAELLRLALTRRQKRFDHVSTFGVPQLHAGLTRASEDTDVRHAAPELTLGTGYAAGYGASKWASEVLLREAYEHFGLPVTVYRPDMIMAHARFRGQINLPDMFTRLLLSLALTGIAPASFYEPATDGARARMHYDGMPVDFLAAAIQQIGNRPWHGHRTFNTISAHLDDGVSLDVITDWVAAAGYPLQRIGDHADWVRRFADTLRHMPDDQRQQSALPIMAYVERPHASRPAGVRNEAFVSAVCDLPAGPAVPGLSADFIGKYLADLRLLGLLGQADR